jgi:hypothetical protein
MLTVWRHLWIERDSMTGVVPNTINISIAGVTPNVPQPHTGGANDVVQLAASLPSDIQQDELEGGTLSIPSFGNKAVRIYLNSDNFGADTLNVPANSFTAAELASIAAAPVTATVVDDDVIPGTGTHALPNGGTLISSAFGDAYILPVYVDPNPIGWNTKGTVTFQRHANDGFTDASSSRNLTSANDFWATQVIGAHENKPGTDADPDGSPAPASGAGVPLPSFDATIDYGYSNKGNSANANVSMIFLETIRDYGPSQGMSEASVVTHEVGHTAGYENPHRSTGIMRASEFGSETNFDDESLYLFRNTILW